jgi:hypothetical protein
MKRLLIIIGLLISSALIFTGCGGRHHRNIIHGLPNNPGTGPTVTSVVPQNNSTGAAINTKVTATFSEAMNPSLIMAAFTLKKGAVAVSGSVSYSGITAVFTPTGNFAPNTLYTATIAAGVKDIEGDSLAGNYTWSFTTGATEDNTAPVVSSTIPANAATGVALNARLAATFSKPMDPTTIAAETFTLKQGVAPVLGAVTYSGVTAVFTPTRPLLSNKVYTATVTTGAKDLADNPLAASHTWSFTTGAASDSTAPEVTAVIPLNGATDVAIDMSVTATFSKAMEPLLIAAAFTLKNGATTVPGSVAYSGVTAVFTPDSNLSSGAVYTAAISTVAKDLAGNPLAETYTWNFTAGTAADTTAPTVSYTAPVNAATGVSTNTKVSATFSEAMNPSLILAAFTLKKGAVAVSGSVSYSGVTAVFTPDVSLAANTVFTASISTDAIDLAGNPLAASHSWSFTTGAAADTTAPTVRLTFPVDGAIDVPIHTKVTATFSEAMDPLTITTATFRLKRGTTGTTTVLGSVMYSGLTAVFSQVVFLLLPNSTYTATITTEATDLAGNALAEDYTWSFTTGDAPDTTRPTVILVDPANLATDVALNSTLTATFSKPMDPLTISTTTFTLYAEVANSTGTTPIYGTVAPDGETAVFTPNNELTADTTYTARISTGAQDLAGNALASDYVWSFSTGVAVPPEPIVDLGAAMPFGSFGGGAGMTNEGLLTVINGDIGTTGAATTITGFHDNVPINYTVTPLNNGWVNGTVFTATSPEAVTGALAARAAYNALTPASMPGGMDPNAGQLGGLTLPPGIYQAAGGSFMLTGSDLTLDGMGDANAVWVFQMASSLTIGAPAAPRTIHLIRGAQSKNIFWQVGSAATINPGGGGTIEGTIIAEAGVTFSTSGSVIITTLNGRALGLNASVTMVNTIINIPAP